MIIYIYTYIYTGRINWIINGIKSTEFLMDSWSIDTNGLAPGPHSSVEMKELFVDRFIDQFNFDPHPYIGHVHS